MASFTLISDAAEIERVKALGKARPMNEYDVFVLELEQGQAVEIEPEDGETVHGIILKIAYAAKRQNRSVATWSANGKAFAALKEEEFSEEDATETADAVALTVIEHSSL